MDIHKLLTTVNFTKTTNKQNKYIVIHYVGAEGGAKDNCRYFEKFYRGASAHYFVGHEGEIWQSVEDKFIAWHCGSSSGYKHAECRNDNSIGIELCCRKRAGNWYFEDATVTAAIGLVRDLMKKYNIPVENVIRHYDVTGKICPAPFVYNNTAHSWNDFIKKIKEEDKTMKLDNTPAPWAKKEVEYWVKKGVLKGDENGNYKLHENLTVERFLVFLYRAFGGK